VGGKIIVFAGDYYLSKNKNACISKQKRHQKVADLKVWSNFVRKANYLVI
jgi:hypothetical protein